MRQSQAGFPKVAGWSDMADPGQQKKWLEALRKRSELMNEIYARVEELSAKGDRRGIVDYVSRTLESTPIESGNTVRFGSLEIEFSDDDRVVDIRSDDGTSSFSVRTRADPE